MSSGSRPATAIAREAGHGAPCEAVVSSRAGDAALADAGALDDPLVGRVDHALEVRVRQDRSTARSVPSR